jgi:hypothetical protein
MSDSKLEVLKQNRDALLRAEVAALLHDMGKFCDLHIEHVSGRKKWSNDDAYKAIMDNPSVLIHLSAAAANIRKPDIINNVLNAQTPKAADFLPTALKDALTNTRITVLDQDYALAELIMLGMPGFATHPQRAQLLDDKDGWLPALLGVCHSEAHVDKEEPLGGQQTLPSVLTSNAFGFEQQVFVLGDAQKSLDAHLKLLPIDAANLITRETRDKIVQTFEQGLGDTRRPINEVTLADWSEIVAALFKSALAGAVLNSTQPGIRQWKSWKDKIIDHDLHWRLLRVNFDELALYAKAVKIADLLGYQGAVKDACAKVKQLIEEEYPLGNEVYRDTTGIYFTFPDMGLPAELAQEIRARVNAVDDELAPRIKVGQADETMASEQLKKLLAEQRNMARTELAQGLTAEMLNAEWQTEWENLSANGKWELCPVCRLRPMKEGEEACEICVERRGSRVNKWLKNPAQTIWMDEIADHNDRVALIVGKFGLDDWLSGDLVQTMLVKAVENNPDACVPKNPSPARLRRVWETCERFWTGTVDRILNELKERARWTLDVGELPKDMPDGAVCDGTLNGQAISVWRQGNHLLTISHVTAEPTGELKVSWEKDGRKLNLAQTIQAANLASEKFLSYHPALTLLESPDQFLALIPARDALNVAEKIRGEYEKQFAKVQNRLPLFLGIVFFQRKTPLAAVMDTARRMLATPVTSEQWTVDTDVDNGAVKFTNGVEWKVPTKMGDGTTDDVWYPYFFVEQFADGTPDQRARRFRHNGQWLVHVNDLRAGDVVCVTPSRFAYLFLESTAQRFQFDGAQDGMLLDELPKVIEMWGDLKKSGITDTGLRGVQALLETKGAAWGAASEELAHLAATTLQQANLFKRKDQKRNPLPDVVTPKDVTSGRLARCLELYTKILKLRMKEENNGQPTV